MTPSTGQLPKSSTRAGVGPGAADAAAWAAADEATRTGREQLLYLLGERETAARISTRFANVGDEQRAGHVFEWQHEVTFNLDALAKHEHVRARVTEWLGEPHAAADLRLFDVHGHVLSEVQAKVVDSTVQRVSPTDGISADKYDGMQLLVPSDHVGSTSDLINRRLAMPEGPLHEHYTDVSHRLTDHITHGDVTSAPLAAGEIAAAPRAPDSWIDGLANRDELNQILDGAGAAGAVAAIVSGVGTLAVSAIQQRSFDGLPWSQAAIRSSAASARSLVIATSGQAVSLAAQHAVAEGAANTVGIALAGGTLPFALARSTLDIAVVAHGFATGRLSSTEAAGAASQAVSRGAAVWACAAVGQSIIPIPVVGAMVGGVVGQLATAMMVKGLQSAIVARDTSAEWDASYELLIQRTVEMQQAAAAELEELSAFAAAYETAFSDLVVPHLVAVHDMLGTGQPDAVLSDLAELTLLYAGTPLFSSMAQFNAFMEDDSSVLVLDLGAPRAD